MERYMAEMLDPLRASFEILSILTDRLVNAGGVDLLLLALDSKINSIEKRWVRTMAFVARDMFLPQSRFFYVS